MASLCNIKTEQAEFGYSLSNDIKPTHQIHCHNVYEIYYFVEGDVDYLVEGKLYQPTPHSLLLLSPHVFHGVKVRSEKPYRRFTLHFHPDLLHPDRRHLLLSAFPSNEKHSRREVYYENLTGTQLGSFFEALIGLADQSEQLKRQLLSTYIEAILAQLTIICQTHSPAQVATRTSHTITDIIAYLNDHLTDPITLDRLSEHFNISKHYMNRAFRKAAGTTVFDYLIYKRVIYAQQLLINGSSATEAALKSGFRDYTVFYRAYRKHLGHPPLEDRSLTHIPHRLS
ncbi:MAG: transcriptional regulator, AraC family [Herbinix sp.]|jgi:AraC-like DNA-binding protein|nr:transcriptional regulator, AraC family [Herbinix sp.]